MHGMNKVVHIPSVYKEQSLQPMNQFNLWPFFDKKMRQVGRQIDSMIDRQLIDKKENI